MEVLGRQWTTLQLSREALAHSNRNSRITMEIFLLRDKRVIDRLLKSRAENTQKISELVTKLESQCGSPEQKRLLEAVGEARTPYVASYQRALHLLVDEGKEDAARAMMVEKTTPALYKYHAAWTTFMQFQMEQMDKAARQSRARYAVARAFVLLLIVLAVFVATSIAVFATRKIVQEVNTRILAEREVRELNAELEHRVDLRTQALRRSEREVQARLAEIEEIYKHAPVGLCLVDREYRFRRINERLAAINGFSAEQHIARTLGEMLPGLGEFLTDNFRQIFESGEPILDVEVHGKTSADPLAERDWLCSYFPLKSEAGEVAYIVSSVLDITEQKRVQQELALKNRIAKIFLTKSNEEMFDAVLQVVLRYFHSRSGLFGYVDDDGAMVCPSAISDVGENGQIASKSIRFSREIWSAKCGHSLLGEEISPFE